MDREEYRAKLEEINHLVDEKDYNGAMKIVENMDWRRVKDVRTLCVVGEIYAANKRYKDSKEIFLLAYHRAPIGKTILYRLIEVSLKMGDIEDAEEFYEEFLEAAPNDNTRFILKYKLCSAKKVPLEEQISILEEYKEREYTERWSYELAKLYYQAGEEEKCIEVCDDLVLWFNDGKYVQKALELKKRMGVLSGRQLKKYEELLSGKPQKKETIDTKEYEEENEEESEETYEEPELQIESIRISQDDELGNTGVFQEKIAQGIKDIFSIKPKEKGETASWKEEEEEEKDEDFASVIQQHGEKPKESEENVRPLESEETQEDSYRNIELSENTEKLEKDSSILGALPSVDETSAFAQEELSEEKELGITKSFNFDLEDTILAAAGEQGIEVPKEEPVYESKQLEESEIPRLEEEFLGYEEEIGDTLEDYPENPTSYENNGWDGDIPLGASENMSEGNQLYPYREEEKPVDSFEEAAEKEIPRLEEENSFEEEEFSEEEEIIEEGDSWLREDFSTKTFEDMESKILLQTLKEEQEERPSKREKIRKEEPVKRMEDPFIQYPQTEANSMDLIPREMTLDEKEQKLFTYFSSIPGIPEQLVEALADIQQAAADKTSKTGNVIIMGSKETGKTRLSQGLILAICRELHMEAAKIATIFGSQLNGKDPAKVVGKMSGGFLVIENASQMSAETIDKLNQAMEFRTDGLTVVIEDEKIGMRKLIAKYPKFAAKFTSMINIPVFTNDELVNFARIYTEENGYVMDQMGVLALYNLIGDNQKEDEPMTIGKVKDMLDNAIARAESGARKFKRNLSKKRTDQEGRVILYEKDFN